MTKMIGASHCVLAALFLITAMAIPQPAIAGDGELPRNNLSNFVAGESGRLPIGVNDVLVEAHGVCRWLDNTSPSADYLVPLKTQYEWEQFIDNAPSSITRAGCCPARTVTLTSSDGSDTDTFDLPVGRVGAADARGTYTVSNIFSFTLGDGSAVIETVAEDYICQTSGGVSSWTGQGAEIDSNTTPPPPPVVEDPVPTVDGPEGPAYIDEFVYSRDCRHKRAWNTPFSLQDTFFKRMASGALQWFNSYPGDSTEQYCMGSRQRNDPAKVVFEFGNRIPAGTYRIVVDSLIGADGRRLQLDLDMLSHTEAGGGSRSGGGKKYSTHYYVASFNPLVIVNEGHHKGSSCKPCSGIAPTWLKVRYYLAGPDGLPPQCGTAVNTTQWPGGDLQGTPCAYGGTAGPIEGTRGSYYDDGMYTWTCTGQNGRSTQCHAAYESRCGGDRFGQQTVRCLEP